MKPPGKAHSQAGGGPLDQQHPVGAAHQRIHGHEHRRVWCAGPQRLFVLQLPPLLRHLGKHGQLGPGAQNCTVAGGVYSTNAARVPSMSQGGLVK